MAKKAEKESKVEKEPKAPLPEREFLESLRKNVTGHITIGPEAVLELFHLAEHTVSALEQLDELQEESGTDPTLTTEEMREHFAVEMATEAAVVPHASAGGDEFGAEVQPPEEEDDEAVEPDEEPEPEPEDEAALPKPRKAETPKSTRKPKRS